MFSYCKFVALSRPPYSFLPDSSDGLAASVLLSVINYVILGFALPVDGFYLHSFEIWLACAVVFPGAGNIGFMMMEYRLGQKNIVSTFSPELKCCSPSI
jgi:hypothetical protein